MDTGNIYRGNTNLEGSIYDFLLAQQNETKKLLDYEIDFTGDLDSYTKEIINPITNDRDHLHTHSASKFYSIILNKTYSHLGQ